MSKILPRIYPLFDEDSGLEVGPGVWVYPRSMHARQMAFTLQGSFVLVTEIYEASIIVFNTGIGSFIGNIEIQDDNEQHKFDTIDQLIVYLNSRGIEITYRSNLLAPPKGELHD